MSEGDHLILVFISSCMQIQEIIVEKLEENWTGFSAALVSYDDQTTGKIHPKELRKVIEKFTIPISDAHFEQ